MHILVAVDESDESQNALERAMEIVGLQDTEITAVHAVEKGEQRTDGETILEDAAERARKEGISITTELLVGDPIEVIPEYAESTDIDVLYVGHRSLPQKGEPETEGNPIGSVAKGIIEKTAVPVTVFDKEI